MAVDAGCEDYPPIRRFQSDATTAFLRAARSGNLEKVIEYLDAKLDINTANSNGLNALHLASKDGHVEIVTELLKRGAQVDAATKKGNTALHIASLGPGQSEIVTILIEYGAAVNIQSQNGFTPLYMAAQENHDQVVKILLTNHANQGLATEDGFTPLAVAMQQGHDKVVSVLLENDSKGKVRLPALHIAAKKDDCKAADLLLQSDHKPDVTSKSGFTPLHIAAHYGNEDIARLLIKRGADVNYLAKHNISPLHVAAKWGKNNMVKILLEHGAVIDAKTRDGLTPLHCAARSGHEQCVTTLLESSAPISARSKNGLAPLHMASQGDHVDAVRVLLYHRAPVDEVTIDYLTSLHVAAHCGHVRVAKLLLDRKADPNARALNGFTPLHIACKKNHIKVVELLLKHGASIESTTESGLTPLHVASFMGCMNIVIFLLQHEANPDVPTVRGETPLHLAARANQTDIIRILLRNGAKVDARAREQQTPLHIASRLGNVDIVMLLLQHGAAVDTTTKDMYTALHIAAKEGQEEVAAILVDNNASIKATTKNGFTPLHVAAKYGNMNVAKILLQKDSKLDVQGKNGITPLLLACHYDHPNVAQLLLERGASPYLASQNGQTPLHIAARKNQMDIATTLLEHGATANVESKAGFTPLHLSAQKGHYDMTNLLIEHGADLNHKAKNGLTALHLCAQEDFIRVASILVKNGANVESETETGYRPIHVAAHFGNLSMVRFLLKHGAEINVKTKQNYTPLHQAAQQGHAHIVTALIEGSASHRARTNDGLTALNIAQKLGYISVMEVLKGLSYDGITPDNKNWEEKYKVIAPESLQETSLMSDSDDEGGSDALMNEQPYRYLTADLMKNLRDDSLPIDVTRDDPIHRQVSKQEYKDFVQSNNYCSAENFDSSDYSRFLVSFLVDARGGTMKGCRHSGIRLIVPPRRATMPIRVTCRLVKPSKMANPPPLMEGESLATRVIEMGPVGVSFLGPVIIDIPYFASIRGKEREIIILRSENGETWKEHDNSTDNDDSLVNTPFDLQMSSSHPDRITRIITAEFPQYFAVVTRIKQEVHVIGAEGGILISSVADQVQAVFPPGALTKKIKVGLQAHVIPAELTAKLLGNCVAVSPVITIEPRRRKFHKPISLTLPVPQAANKGMINHYGGETPTLRLLCSIAGGTSEAQWEDVTGSTPLNFTNDRVSFTTTVSARFWLMDCRNIQEVPKMATDLYRESLFVPFITNFVIYSKRMEEVEATLRILCMTDSKEGIHTLEKQEELAEIVKSRDVETLDGKDLYIEFTGNLVPVTKSGQQLKFTFKAFRQNRLSFHVKVKDPQLDPVARMMFMRDPKVAKGEPAQQPLCVLNIVLPDVTFKDKNKAIEDANILAEKLELLKSSYKLDYPEEKGDYPKRTSPGEKKFITDTLQKEYPDATVSLLAQKSAILLESADVSFSGQELSPVSEKKTYTEKRRFWEDIAHSKRESFQRSESEVSHTSQLTYHDSDSECLSEVRERSEDEAVDHENLVGTSVDMSEATVAEKAHYFEEQIQKETSAARGSLKSQSSSESARVTAARLSGISLSSEDDRYLEVFEETERILEERTRKEMEMRDKTEKADSKTWDKRKEEKKDNTTEKSGNQKSREGLSLFDNKIEGKEVKDDKKTSKDDVPKKGERKKSRDEKDLMEKKDFAKEEKKDERRKSKEGKDMVGKKQDSKEDKSERRSSKGEKDLSDRKNNVKEIKNGQEKKGSEKKTIVTVESTTISKIESELLSKETLSKIDKKITGEKSDIIAIKKSDKLDTKTKTITKTDTDKVKATKMQENVSKQQKVAESKPSMAIAKSTKMKEETTPKSIPSRQKSKEDPLSKSPPKKDKLKDDILSKSPPKKDKSKDDALQKSSPKLDKPKEITSKVQSKIDKGKEISSVKSQVEGKVKHDTTKSIAAGKEVKQEETLTKFSPKSEKQKIDMISSSKKEIQKTSLHLKEEFKENVEISSHLEKKSDESVLPRLDLKISDVDEDKKTDVTEMPTFTTITSETTHIKYELTEKTKMTAELPKTVKARADATEKKKDDMYDIVVQDSKNEITVQLEPDTQLTTDSLIKIPQEKVAKLGENSQVLIDVLKQTTLIDDKLVEPTHAQMTQIIDEKMMPSVKSSIDEKLKKSSAETFLKDEKLEDIILQTLDNKNSMDKIPMTITPKKEKSKEEISITSPSEHIKPTELQTITPKHQKSKDEIPKFTISKTEKSKDKFNTTSPPADKKPIDLLTSTPKHEKSKDEIPKSMIPKREKSKEEFYVKSPPANKKPTDILTSTLKREKSIDEIPKSMIPKKEKSKDEFSIKSLPADKKASELPSSSSKREKSNDEIPKSMIPKREKSKEEFFVKSPPAGKKPTDVPTSAPKREKSKEEIPKSMIPKREKSKEKFFVESPPADKKASELPSSSSKREKSNDEIPKSMIPKREKSKEEFFVKSPPADKKPADVPTSAPKREKSKDEIPKSMIPKREKSKDEIPKSMIPKREKSKEEFFVKSPPADKKPTDVPTSAPKRERSKDEMPKSMIPKREKSKEEFFVKSPPADKKPTDVSTLAPKREKSKDEIPKSMISKREKSKEEFFVKSPPADKKASELPSSSFKREKSNDEIPKSMIPKREKSKEEFFVKSPPVDKKPTDVPTSALKREKSKDEIPKSMITKREKSKDEIPKSMIPKREKSKEEFSVKSPPADKKPTDVPTSAPKRERSKDEIPKSMIPKREKSKEEFFVKSPPADKKPTDISTLAPKREKSKDEISKSMIPKREKSKDEFSIKSPSADKKSTEVLTSAASATGCLKSQFSQASARITADRLSGISDSEDDMMMSLQVFEETERMLEDKAKFEKEIGDRITLSHQLPTIEPKREESKDEIPKSMIPRREKSNDAFPMKSLTGDEKTPEKSIMAPKREKSKDEIPKSMIPRREKSKDEFVIKSSPMREKSIGEIPRSMIPKREKSKDEFLLKSPPKDSKDKAITTSNPKREKSFGEIPKSMIPRREKSKDEISLKSPPKDKRDSKELPSTAFKREKSSGESPKSMISKRERSLEEFSLKSPPKKEKSKEELSSKLLSKREKSREEMSKSIPKREKSKDEIPSKSFTKREKSKEDIATKIGIKRQDSRGEASPKTTVKKTETSGKTSLKKEDSKEDLLTKSGVKRRDSKEEQSKISIKKSTESLPKSITKREFSREEIPKTPLVRRRDSKEDSLKFKDEVPKTPLSRRRDLKEESSKSSVKRAISLKNSDSKSSSKSSSPSPKPSEKLSKKDSLTLKELETITVTKKEKSEEIVTQEYEEHTRKQTSKSQLYAGSFTGDPKDALKLLEDTSALKKADFITSASVITSKVDHKASSSSEKKEVKSSEIDTGQEKIIALEEKEDIQKKEISFSLSRKDSPVQKVEENESKIKELSLSATQKTLVCLTDDFEKIQASGLQIGQDSKHSIKSRSVEDDEKIVTTTETSNLLKESTIGAHVALEKDLNDKSIKSDDIGKIIEKSIFEEKNTDSSKTFDVKQDLKKDLDTSKKDISKTVIGLEKDDFGFTQQKIKSPESGTIESEVFHDKLADNLTKELSTMHNTTEELLDSTLVRSAHDSGSVSLSEDITKDESSSLQFSLSQTKVSEDITASPSMSEKVDINDSSEVNKDKTSTFKKEMLLEDAKLGKMLVEGKFVSQLSGARVLEILEPENENQSRQDSMDASSIEVDEIKISSTEYDVPIKEESLHESPAIDSLDTLEHDLSMSSATFSEDTNIDYYLPQDNHKKQDFCLEKIPVRRKIERDSFEIESPPLISPRLKVKELEIKPVDWMIGDEKIEVSETLEPSQAFNKELEEYQMSLKQQELEEDINTFSSRKFEIPRIEKTSCTSFDDLESVKQNVKSKFTVIPVSEQDLDMEKELVENKLEISCQELMDTLQREYDAKTPTDDRLEEMAAKSFQFMTIDDDEDSFDYDEKKYEVHVRKQLESSDEKNLKITEMPLETKTAVNVIQGEQFTSLVEPLKPTEVTGQARDSELLQLYEERFEETVEIKDVKKESDTKITEKSSESIYKCELDKSSKVFPDENLHILDKDDKQKQSYDLKNFQHPPEPSELLLKTEDGKSEREEKKSDVHLLSYKAFDPEGSKKDDSHSIICVQKPSKTEFHKEGKIDVRSKGWDDHKRIGDKREKAHSHQETSSYKVKKEDFQNVDMSARYAITVLDQVVKKEIAEVKENLEAAKQDLIEELSENSDNVIQIKDSPSEFQFKIQPESIPNELPFLYKAPSLEKVTEAENLSSSSSPVAKPRRHSEIAREESSSESSLAEKKVSNKDISKTSIVIESESDKSSQRDSKDIFESFSSSPKAASKSSSDAEEMTKDETFSLQPPQPAPRRRPKSSHSQHRITSESEADISSSGESNYQSCEYESGSRPCSSDVEALQSAAQVVSSTASEYETAAMSMEHSSKGTSQDYFTAMNTLSSRESMKSLASISSGQMGSLDSTSELSETLMASEPELDQDALDENLEDILDDDTKISDEGKLFNLDPAIPCMMKRSSEMIFSQVITQESSSESKLPDAKLSDSSTVTEKDFSSSSSALKTDLILSKTEDSVTRSTTTQRESQKIISHHDLKQTSTTPKVAEQKSELTDESILSSFDLNAESCSFEPDSLDVKYISTSSLDEESTEGHGPGSGLTLQQQLSMTSSSMSGVSLETVIEKEADRNSDSDSFELVDKPDIIDDFVVVEEIGREADEFDSEGKGIRISSMSFVSNKDYDRDVENLIMEKQESQKPQAHSTRSTIELFDFESEESPPQASNEDQYSQSYSDEEQYSESGKKWVEMQFQQNETRLYDLEYERGPLEDIKEEEVADFEAGSSRFGSVGSQKESIGSIGSMRGSFGSTPDNFDALTVKRHFKPTDHDNLSLSSLQEFEHLENAVALENAKRREQQHSSSQDSSSNGSLPRRYHASKSGHGDDVSVSSVKDFEVLEKACKEAHMIELRAREEEDLLDHESPENRFKLESLARAKAESQGSAAGSFNPSTSGSDDYEKRIKEIDEIIRLAQANVEKIERHDDTTEDVSQIDLTDDKPASPITIIAAETSFTSSYVPIKAPPKSVSDMNIMQTSTDSLELESNAGHNYNIMCQSSDSLELKTTLDYPSISSDSLNNVKDPKEENERRFSSRRISSDSLETPAQESQESKDKSKDSSTDS